MVDKLPFVFADDLRGVVLPFRPRARDAVEIANVKLIGDAPGDVTYAMDDDNSPCERNPDPFEADAMQTNAKPD